MGDITEQLDEMHAAVVGFLPESLMDLSDLAAARAGLDALFEQMPAPDLPASVTVSDHNVPGADGDPDVLVRVYTPSNAQPGGPALYWMHGGGLVLLTVDADDLACAMRAEALGVVVASVDYRLAPETPYPGPMNDCYAGLSWFASAADELGFDASRIVVGGASAGACLAAGLALMARDKGGPALTGQFLVYPMLDDRNESASAKAITDTRVWNHSANAVGWSSYLGDLDGADAPPYAVPARATDLSGLPPAFINVGAHDMFLDEDIAYARALMAAGVDCELKVYPKAFHGSNSFVAEHPDSIRWAADEHGALQRLLGTA